MSKFSKFFTNSAVFLSFFFNKTYNLSYLNNRYHIYFLHWFLKQLRSKGAPKFSKIFKKINILLIGQTILVIWTTETERCAKKFQKSYYFFSKQNIWSWLFEQSLSYLLSATVPYTTKTKRLIKITKLSLAFFLGRTYDLGYLNNRCRMSRLGSYSQKKRRLPFHTSLLPFSTNEHHLPLLVVALRSLLIVVTASFIFVVVVSTIVIDFFMFFCTMV